MTPQVASSNLVMHLVAIDNVQEDPRELDYRPKGYHECVNYLNYII